jgi:hypothetical protein
MRTPAMLTGLFALLAGIAARPDIPRPAANAATQPVQVEFDFSSGRPLPPGLDNDIPRAAGGWPLGALYGTQVTLKFKRLEGNVLDIDHAASKLDRLVDDADTILNDVVQKNMPKQWPTEDRPQLKRNPEMAAVHFWLPKIPSDKARRVTISGEAVLLCGVDPKTTDTIKLGIAQARETKLAIGELKAQFWVYPPDDHQREFQVRLEVLGRIAQVNDVEFFDGEGNPLIAERNGSLYGKSNGQRSEGIDWRLKSGAPKGLQARVRYFQRVERVTVPFHAEARIKPPPPEPAQAVLNAGPLMLELNLKYDRYALRDADLTPQAVDVQVSAYLLTADSLSPEAIKELKVLTPTGQRVALRFLAESVEIKLRRKADERL